MVKSRVPKEEICHQCSLTPNAHATPSFTYLLVHVQNIASSFFFFQQKILTKKLGKFVFLVWIWLILQFVAKFTPKKNIDCKDIFGRIEEMWTLTPNR